MLLSFGILAGPSAPIVSAASEAIQNEMTDDTTSNEVTSDTTSVVEESVPVKNNTADTLTTDNTEVSANYSENTDDSTTTTVQTDTDVSTQEKTDPEISVNTEQPIQTEEAESTTPVEDINSKSEENVSQNNNINTSKEGTNKKDKPNIKINFAIFSLILHPILLFINARLLFPFLSIIVCNSNPSICDKISLNISYNVTISSAQ